MNRHQEAEGLRVTARFAMLVALRRRAARCGAHYSTGLPFVQLSLPGSGNCASLGRKDFADQHGLPAKAEARPARPESRRTLLRELQRRPCGCEQRMATIESMEGHRSTREAGMREKQRAERTLTQA